MKTEVEFNKWLKRCLRCGRKGLWATRIARNMRMQAAVYSAYERGKLPMSVYHLYQFMHATGCDAEFIKQIFDDDLQAPIAPKYRILNNKKHKSKQ